MSYDSSVMTNIVTIAAMMFGYFLPALIAGARYHSNFLVIFMVNLFLGWTVIGWLVAFFWSFTDNTKRQTAGEVKQ